ncbi:MAG: hypothetical protein CMH95_02805 [Oceanospirillaceae bacterium]|nr:hypothetical protein [Oceanospirillaceae bacterium]
MVKLLTGPDFSDQVIFTFTTDVASIYISVPAASIEKTKSCDTEIGSLSDHATYDVPSEDWMSSKRVMRSSFQYYRESSGLELCSTKVMIQIIQISKEEPVKTLLTGDDVKNLLIKIKNRLKEELIAEDFNQDFFVFPNSVDEAEQLNANNINWSYIRAGYVELGPPKLCFATPLNSNNLLLIEANTGSYNFVLPDGQQETMIEEAEADLFDFIKSIRIEFSPEIQAQIDEARATESV